MFACAAPEPLGLLHCIGLDDNGVSKGVWNVVSGALRYDFHELAMSPGCFSNAVGNVYSWVRQGTLELRHNGDTIGVAVVPNGDDDAIGVGVSFDMDVTGQCAGVPAPINTRVPVERPALWLGFTPDFAFASSGQSFYGEGTVFDRGQSKLTCEWEFEFHDVYPP
jgi:hypothetical protein